jgi:hypothetical protein
MDEFLKKYLAKLEHYCHSEATMNQERGIMTALAVSIGRVFGLLWQAISDIHILIKDEDEAQQVVSELISDTAAVMANIPSVILDMHNNPKILAESVKASKTGIAVIARVNQLIMEGIPPAEAVAAAKKELKVGPDSMVIRSVPQDGSSDGDVIN